MTSMTLKLAQRASKDPSLIASLIDRYGAIKRLAWEEIGNELWIDNQRLAKLALCRLPRPESYNEDISQVAEYVGINPDQLTEFIRNAKSTPNKPARKNETTHSQVPNKSNRALIWAVGIAALVLVVLSTFILLQPAQASGTAVVRRGSATVIRQGSIFKNGKTIEIGDQLTVKEGDTILVGDTGFVQLRFQDGSTIDLLADSKLEVEQLNISNENYQVRLRLLAGKAVNRVIRLLNVDDFYEIVTPSSTISVRGTVFSVKVLSPDVTYVTCEEGVVQVQLADQVVQVQAGEEVTASPNTPMQVQPITEFEGQPDELYTNPSDIPQIIETTPTVESTPPALLATPIIDSDDSDDTYQIPATNPDNVDDSSENPPPGQGGDLPSDGAEPPGQGIPPGKNK